MIDEPIFKELTDRLDRIESKLTVTPPTWLSVSDLAAYLGCSESLIRKLLAAGELPFRRIGDNGKIVFNRRQIDLWLLSGEKHPGKRARALFSDLL